MGGIVLDIAHALVVWTKVVRKFIEESFERFLHYIDEGVQATAVRHPNDGRLGTTPCSVRKECLHTRNHNLAAVHSEPLFRPVLLLDKFLCTS